MIELPTDLELAARIALAFVLGAVVGFEREVNDQPAGLRTHIAVSLGACLFAIISAYGFDEFRAERATTNYQVDVTRVASQIVTGMGFLGAGAIVKFGPTVRGLTTAASLWVTAAIGLAVAIGSYAVALITTGAILLSLALRWPKRWIEDRFAMRRAEMALIRVAEGAPSAPVVAAAAQIPGLKIRSIQIERDELGRTISLRADVERDQSLEALLAPLADRDDVVAIEVG